MAPEELKAWRENNGFSQSQLAKMLGLTHQSISRWECGRRHIPAFLHLALKSVEQKKVSSTVNIEHGGK
jgi:transcriptional regulator with XRE-family HTH domain